jgi:hypothetical protein
MTALHRHRSFGFGSKPIIEVSSPAVAARLAALLNAGSAPALHADYAARASLQHVRDEVARRDRCDGRAARARVAYKAAMRVAAAGTTPQERLAALERAGVLRRKAASFAATAAKAGEKARLTLASLDPSSPESVAARAAHSALQLRVAAYRAAKAQAAVRA